MSVEAFYREFRVIAVAIAAPTKNLAAACSKGYIYLFVEPLIFRVQIDHVAIVAATPANPYGLV